MRLVTEKICQAFQERTELKLSNSFTDGDSLWLFGNMIAMYRNGDLFICNGGWNSVTTKERLNGLNGVSIVQRIGVWFLNGNEWDGSWVSVNNPTNIINVTREAEIVQEIDFDTTLEWIEKGGYNKPIYSVAHVFTQEDVFEMQLTLDVHKISYKIIEIDTAGVYKPNFFFVVRPDDHQKTLSILNQIK